MERCGQENLHIREKKEIFLAYLSYYYNRRSNRSAAAAASEPSTLNHRELDHCENNLSRNLCPRKQNAGDGTTGKSLPRTAAPAGRLMRRWSTHPAADSLCSR